MNEIIKKLQDKHILDSYSPANIGLPAGILSGLSNEVVENITSVRSAELMVSGRDGGGLKKLIDWSKEKIFIPFIEKTGQTSDYGDYASAKNTALNLDFNEYGHYRFSANVSVGDLEKDQLAEAKINAIQYKNGAALEALAIKANDVFFHGHIKNSSNKYVCYGILNAPELPAFETASKTFSAMTYAEVIDFFGEAVADLVTQTGGHINTNSNIRVCMSAKAFVEFTKITTEFGMTAKKAIENAYPNMTFESIYELGGAYNDSDCIYFIGESFAGGVKQTIDLGYSELYKYGALENHSTYTSQKISSGVIGAVIYKPLFVKRYAGV